MKSFSKMRFNFWESTGVPTAEHTTSWVCPSRTKIFHEINNTSASTEAFTKSGYLHGIELERAVVRR